MNTKDTAPTISELPELREMEDVLRRNGFVRCDLAACNCGSWHARYGLPERMDEIKEALSEAGHPLCNENGNLTLNALKALIAERDVLADRATRRSTEGWMPVGDYLVSQSGLIRNKDGNLLGQWKNSDGYFLVRLSNPRRIERVHRMVAQAFVAKPEGCDVVNHIDCDRANNSAANLEWCTQKHNLAHSESLGRMRRDYWTGKRSPNAALIDEQVRQIRFQYSSGSISLEALSKQFGMSKRCIGRIVNMEVYKNVL